MRVQGLFATDGFFGLRLQFEVGIPPRGRFISWDQSSKLKYGQLLLLSDDGFQRSLVLGVIRQRDGKKMDQEQNQFGYVSIYIELMDSPDRHA